MSVLLMTYDFFWSVYVKFQKIFWANYPKQSYIIQGEKQHFIFPG